MLETAYPKGGRRGRLALGELTAEERRAQELDEVRARALEEGWRLGREETLIRLEPFIRHALEERGPGARRGS